MLCIIVYFGTTIEVLFSTSNGKIKASDLTQIEGIGGSIYTSLDVLVFTINHNEVLK